MRSVLAVVLVASAALADPPAVTFPEVKTPAPMPSAVATLTADRLFVVESKDPVTILSSPSGLVKVSKESGPLTVYSRFADGGDKPEKRTYQGPFVFLLEPLKSGDTELLVIPEKVTSEADILRRQLRVDAGEGPKPPPVDPTPAPAPGTSPFPADAGFKVLVVYEKDELAKLPQSQLAAITSADVRAYLTAKAGQDGYVFTDKDVSYSAKLWADAMKRERKSLPWIVVGNGKTGYEGPLPGNVDDTLKLLKTYGGN